MQMPLSIQVLSALIDHALPIEKQVLVDAKAELSRLHFQNFPPLDASEQASLRQDRYRKVSVIKQYCARTGQGILVGRMAVEIFLYDLGKEQAETQG